MVQGWVCMMIDRKFHRLQLSAAVGYDERVFHFNSWLVHRLVSGIKGTTIFHFQNHTGKLVWLSSQNMFFWLGLYHATAILLFLSLLTDAEVYRPHSCRGVFSSNFFIRGESRFHTAQLTMIFSFHSILFSVSYIGSLFKSSNVFHHRASLAQLTIKILSGCWLM